jgi:hypothetical protein
MLGAERMACWKSTCSNSLTLTRFICLPFARVPQACERAEIEPRKRIQ